MEKGVWVESRKECNFLPVESPAANKINQK